MLTNGYSNYPMILPLWHTMTIPCVFGASTASDHAKRLGEVLVLKDAAELAADHQIHPMQLNLQAEVEFHLAKLIEVWAFPGNRGQTMRNYREHVDLCVWFFTVILWKKVRKIVI